MNARARDFFGRLRRFGRDERGTQLVELAVVLPILLILFASVAEFGRFYYEYTTLAKGARVGTRFLATARTDGLDDLAAKNLVVYGNMNGTGSPIISGLTTAHVTISRLNAAGNPQVSGVPKTVGVQITTYKYTPIFNLGKLMNNSALSLNIEVKPSVTMRYLLTQPPNY
jgi:Flp pilus assembly protein TadG